MIWIGASNDLKIFETDKSPFTESENFNGRIQDRMTLIFIGIQERTIRYAFAKWKENMDPRQIYSKLKRSTDK